jgi:ABC-2 type transport system permease protein
MSRTRRLRAIGGYEFRMQVTSAPFLALLLMLVGAVSTLNPMAMIPGGAAAAGAERAFANSVYALSPTFAMSAFFVYPFFTALMAGLSVMRDDEAQISELVHSTPLSRGEYLWAKCGGIAAALGIAVLFHLATVIAFREFGVGGVARGPLLLSAYVTAAMLFVVPTVVWIAGLSFAVGARLKSPMAVYALPVALFVAEFVLFWNWRPRTISPLLDTLLLVADPTGLRWLSHVLFAENRGVHVYNTAPLAVDALLLIGRCVTLLIPLVVIAFLARDARGFRVGAQKRESVRARLARWRPAAMQPRGQQVPSGVSDDRSQRRAPSFTRAIATVMGAELRLLLRQPSLALFLALLCAVVVEVGGGEADAYGSVAVLTAGGIAVQTLPVVTVLTCLYLLFVIVESWHRDRQYGFEAIALSSPIATTALVAGRALATTVLIVAVGTMCAASAATLLQAQHAAVVAWWPLVVVYGAVLTPTFVVWTAFVTTVMAMVRSRTTALAIGLLALLLTAAQFMRGAMTWLSNWPLWGALRWTEFALFPLDGEALLLNRAFALSVAAGLFVMVPRLFERTERDAGARRARRTPRAVLRGAWRAAPLIALPAFTGTFLAVQVHQSFDGPLATQAAVAYETANQRTWAPVIPAVIRHADIALRLQPSERAVEVRGTYLVENRNQTPMTVLPFSVPRTFGVVEWHVSGTVVTPRVSSGLHLLDVPETLPPGDSVRVSFAYRARINEGISQNGASVASFVVPSAVLLSTHRGDFLPIPGYQRSDDDVLRLLPASLPASPPPSTSNETITSFNRGWSFTARMEVWAPVALTINAVGERIVDETVGSEQHTVWETTHPIVALNVVGARYTARRADGVAVYHHPAHTASVEVMLTTLAAARRRYAEWFAPFPWTELRLSEYPDLSSQATSYATNIVFSEGLGFLTSSGPHGGLAFAVTAHEAAHQWWGHLLTAGNGPGTGFLIEGMADYATLLLYGAERGDAARRAYATLLEQQYLDARNATRERSLLETAEGSAADETVLQKKGAWAMWMLHETLGDARTFTGMRRFFEAYRRPGQLATPDSLLRTLRGVAGDTIAYDRDVQQWFRTTQLPELVLDTPTCHRVTATWVCEATLRNRGDGDARVDVVAHQGNTSLPGGRAPLVVRAGASTRARWALATAPDRFVVDPEIRVLQARRNVQGVAPLF